MEYKLKIFTGNTIDLKQFFHRINMRQWEFLHDLNSFFNKLNNKTNITFNNGESCKYTFKITSIIIALL